MFAVYQVCDVSAAVQFVGNYGTSRAAYGAARRASNPGPGLRRRPVEVRKGGVIVATYRDGKRTTH